MIKMPKNMRISVDVRTGAFEYHAVDLVIPAPGFDFRVERWYTSLGHLGPRYGLRFDWDERLEFDELDDSVRHYHSGHNMSRFVRNLDGSLSPAVGWTYSSLEQVSEISYVLTTRSGERRYFLETGELVRREDRFGNTMSFLWSDGHVRQMVDSTGRAVDILWEDGYRRIRVRDWTGRELVYTLDEPDGFLISYQDAEGNVTTYTRGGAEDGPGSLNLYGVTAISLPNGLWVRNERFADIPQATMVGRQVFGNGRERTFDYDQVNRITTVTDDGRVTTYEWNADGNLVEKVDPLGNVWSYEYNANNQVTKIIEPNLATVEMTYDSKGNMLTRKNQKGKTWTYEYHTLFNTVTKVTGPAPFSYVTEFLYDADTGALLERIDPLLKSTLYEYHPNGKLKKVTPPGTSPNIVEFTYDVFGNLTQVENGLNKTTTFEYDSVGNQVAATDPLGHRTRREFDRMNRPTLVRSALGNTTRMAYDGNGNLVTVTDPLNRGTRFEYGSMDELTRVVDPAGGTVTYSYDLHHNLVKQVDPNGHAYEFEYDELDRQIRTVDPMGQVTETEHSAFCGTMTVVDAEGLPTSLHRDVTCLPTARVFADSSAFAFSYDEEQRRTAMTQPQPLKFGQFSYGAEKYGHDPADTTTFAWDGNHRLTQVGYPGGNDIDFTWDDAGRLSSITDIHGTAITYVYDAANRLTSVTRATKVTSYAYDDANRLTLLTYPNGVTCEFTYDDDSRVTRMLWEKGVTTLYDIVYEYDRAGNRTQRKVAVATDPAVVEDFAYDALSRLVRVDEDDTPRSQYRFDAAGNRLLKKSLPDSSSATEEFSEYDASDELVATNAVRFRWDRVGQLVEQDDPAESNPTRYDWNYAHRLRKVTLPDLTSAEYRYNGDELRAYRKEPSGVVTNYYWVPGGVLGLSQVLNELDGAGAQKANYVLGPNGLIGIIDGSGNERYYIFDALGSVLALTDATGAVTDTYTYDDYGGTTNSTGASYNPLRFAGQQFDPETGFYYLRNRYYAPDRGAFIRRDPLLNLTPTNRYQYVNANPTNVSDPLGLSPFWECLSLAGLVPNVIDEVARQELEKTSVYAAQEYEDAKRDRCSPDELDKLRKKRDDAAHKAAKHVRGRTPRSKVYVMLAIVFCGTVALLSSYEDPNPRGPIFIGPFIFPGENPPHG